MENMSKSEAPSSIDHDLSTSEYYYCLTSKNILSHLPVIMKI